MYIQILSIAKALPLQIHPSKDLAARLHEEHPEQFTDPNHKPEIAVALSRFEVFAGWKPLSRIEPLFRLPALLPFVPENTNTTEWSDRTLREVTHSLLQADAQTTKQVQDFLLSTDTTNHLGDGEAYIQDLLPRLREQYGDQDPGSLVALLCMNFMTLDAGDAIYIPADGIHAYLSGDIVECMARSNNVLNAGFCPRVDRDNIDLFTDALTFRAHSPRDMMLPSRRSEKGRNGNTVVYRPPISEFDLLKCELASGQHEVLSASEGPGVFIVTRGRGRMEAEGKGWDLDEGTIFFVAPGVPIRWETEKGLEVHMAVVT
jgi:mannose-6-phosphate isomerase